MSANALLGHFGLAEVSALTLEQGLSAGQGASIAARAGLSAQTIDGMTFAALAPHARFMIAPSARYFCPSCAETPAIGRRDAALPWTFWCSVHGVRLRAREKRPMESFLPESVLERLDPLARRGAARLAAWAEDRDPMGETGSATVPDVLRFLTAFLSSPVAAVPGGAAAPFAGSAPRQPCLSNSADRATGPARCRAGIQSLRARSRQAGSTGARRSRARLAVAELRFGGRRGAPDRKPRRARRSGAGSG